MQAQTINLSLPKKLLQAADQAAKAEMRSRSELLREALRTYLLRKHAWEDIFRVGERQAKKLAIRPSDIEGRIDEYRSGK